jgi:hypothetical protein
MNSEELLVRGEFLEMLLKELVKRNTILEAG